MIRVRIGDYKKVFVYFTIVAALLNATLRFSESGATTVYRLLAPFVVVPILLKYYRYYRTEIVGFGFLILYSIGVSILFYSFISYEYILFAIYIFAEYVLIKWCKITDENFSFNFYRFISVVTTITIIAAFVQYFFRYTLPYLALPAYNGVNVFMSNENELGEAFACVALVYFYLLLYKKHYKLILPIVSILFFLFIGDVKLSLLGLLFGVVILYVYKLFWVDVDKKLNPKNFFKFSFMLLSAVIITVFIWNPEIKFRTYNSTPRDLLLAPIISLLTLEPMRGVGSINDRTNAIIFGITELKRTYGFGIGLGNSVRMLQFPEYKLATAKSMHNIIAQMVTEYGYVAFAILFIVSKKIIFGLKYFDNNGASFLKSVFFIAFILISSQSSIGILSNYYTIMIVCYLILIEKDDDMFVLTNRL